MKVVLFCGGLGLRMRDVAPEVPKPMMPVAGRPILLHIMKYYAHFGHTDFILCLGYKSQLIKDFFKDSNRCIRSESNASENCTKCEFLDDDQVWSVTLVETGLDASIGERLRAIRNHIGDDEMFLANYSDVLTDVPLNAMIDHVIHQEKTASFLCVRPTYTSHVVTFSSDGTTVAGIQDIRCHDIWINGGYFVFRREVFDYLGPGEDLVEEPFRRLIDDEQLLAYRYEGFWVPMDTFKDRQSIQLLDDQGVRPWAVWETAAQPVSGLA
jgi:glucose-1-phosphate cytidylyltransferase